MRRELIPLVVAFVLTACTLDHNGLGTGGDDVPVPPDHVGLDVESGMDVAIDAEAGADAEAGFDAETGMDVPAEIAVETGVDVQPDLPVVDMPIVMDTATTCGSTAQVCCTTTTPPPCASVSNLCLANDMSSTSCAPCGGPGEPCCTAGTACRDVGFSCHSVSLLGVFPAMVCLHDGAAAGTPGWHCASTAGGTAPCSADAACLPVIGDTWCFRCGELGGFCCGPTATARCASGTCDTSDSSRLSFCR